MIGVLLMSYGSPDNLDEVEAYYTDIRHGRKPSPEEVANLKEKYQAIGGQSPLLDIVKRQAAALERKLMEDRLSAKVYIGMKHWHPYIRGSIQEIARDKIVKLIAVPLAPHYSKISIGGYRDAVINAQTEFAPATRIDFIDSWHLHPGLLSLWQGLVEKGLASFTDNEDVLTLFTAHSLPERILAEGDPYQHQLLETSSRIAKTLNIRSWDFAFQSAGHTSEKWLGPDILEKIRELKGRGVNRILVVPVGFFSDHLEILYDLDIEALGVAKEIGVELKRTELPNDTPSAIRALSSLVEDRTTMA